MSDSEEEAELSNGLRATFCKPESQISQYRETPTPTPLPSQLPRRGLETPLSMQMSPAPKNSIPELLEPVDKSIVKPNVDSETIMPAPLPSALALDMKQPPPIDKKLPCLPNQLPAVLSSSLHSRPSRSDLPFSFTPLLQRKCDHDPVPELDAVAPSYLRREEQYHDTQEDILPTKDTKASVDRKIAASPLTSRPWNLDAIYPWNNQVPELEVTMPNETQDPVPKLSRFKLKIHRASSSMGKLTKQRHSSETTSTPFALSHDILQGPAFRRKRDPNLGIFPGQINSSNVMMQLSPHQTRFVENFEQHSPIITLLPPSPEHEVRSFLC